MTGPTTGIESADASTLRVLSWNLNLFTGRRMPDKIRLLESLEWDVALLQEIERPRFRDLIAAGLATPTAAAYGCDLAESGMKRPNAVAVLVRNGWTIRHAHPLPSQERFTFSDDDPTADDAVPRPTATVVAHLTGPQDQAVTAVSFHAPNAVGGTWHVTRKLRAYGDLHAWLLEQEGPTVVGMDANAWTDAGVTDPFDPAPMFREPEQEQAFIQRFIWDPQPDHHLCDVFRTWLHEHPVERERIRTLRPNGPLAVTYARGGTRVVGERFDLIFASSHFNPLDVRHDYADAIAAGSDHAVVLANLRMQPTPGI
jgi:exonuclease III